MKYIISLLLLVVLYLAYLLFVQDKVNLIQVKQDLSVYTGYEVEIEKSVVLGTGETAYYVSFNTGTKYCHSIIGNEFEHYYYIHIPKCEVML